MRKIAFSGRTILFLWFEKSGCVVALLLVCRYGGSEKAWCGIFDHGFPGAFLVSLSGRLVISISSDIVVR